MPYSTPLILACCFQIIYAIVTDKSETLCTETESAAKNNYFLQANSAKEGTITTASGLEYQNITEGTGATPKATDTVTVHYKGTLMNGTVFDSSYERGQPTTFPLNRVIPGWTEGLQLMKVGGKARLIIPPELGYGTNGVGGVIPPNAVLVFEIELLEIK